MEGDVKDWKKEKRMGRKMGYRIRRKEGERWEGRRDKGWEGMEVNDG